MRSIRTLVVFAASAAMLAQATPGSTASAEGRINIGALAVDATEVTVGAFAAYAAKTGLITAAEREGGGFEYVAGWVRRAGWTFRAPSGEAASADAPVAHVTWAEADAYCRAAGGRLPTLAEWRSAAFTEQRPSPADGFVTGRTYPYPVGETPEGMNLNGADGWPRHAIAGATKRGVNGLHDMGGNVWEWLADRRGTDALTAGGSWWYGASQTQATSPQWKPADFYAVYVGFRCVYDARGG